MARLPGSAQRPADRRLPGQELRTHSTFMVKIETHTQSGVLLSATQPISDTWTVDAISPFSSLMISDQYNCIPGTYYLVYDIFYILGACYIYIYIYFPPLGTYFIYTYIYCIYYIYICFFSSLLIFLDYFKRHYDKHCFPGGSDSKRISLQCRRPRFHH